MTATALKAKTAPTPTLSDELLRLSEDINSGTLKEHEWRKAAACIYAASQLIVQHAPDADIPNPAPPKPVDTAARLHKNKRPAVGEVWMTSMGPATVVRVDPEGRFFPVTMTLRNKQQFDSLCLSPKEILSGEQFRLERAPKP